MPHLIIIHIGPVQEFIATARRSRDLWFGSWLLSELSKAVAATLVDPAGGEGGLLFPAPEGSATLAPDSDLNVANKVVAILPGLPDNFDSLLREAVQARLRTLWSQARARREFQGALQTEEIAWQQIAEMPELFWVSVPLTGRDETAYVAARRQAEALMAARKTARTFGSVGWEQVHGQPKSSLDGSRESVIPEDAFPQRGDDSATRDQKIQALYDQYGARAAERLSGVDLLKRHGSRSQQDDFPSTSHIAAQPLLEWLQTLPSEAQNRIRGEWMGYVSSLPRQAQERTSYRHPVLGSSDASMLFESRLRENLDEAAFDNAQVRLQTFFNSSMEGRFPLPYYAILLADGDRMGKVIDNQKSPDSHRDLSGRLASFATGAAELVGQHGGALIYAGGDDVLALLPIHRVITCARLLAAHFADLMADFTDQDGKAPTLSAGVAITHHIEPLSDALDLARQAEKVAKGVADKNALAVTVSKRSGANVTVQGHWGDLDARLLEFAELHRQEAVPDGAAFELRTLALRFSMPALSAQALQQAGQHSGPRNDEERIRLGLGEGIIPEAKRILGRKRGQQGSQSITDTVLNSLVSRLGGGDNIKPDADLGTQLLWAHQRVAAVSQLADELIVARLLAEAVDQAASKEVNA